MSRLDDSYLSCYPATVRSGSQMPAVTSPSNEWGNRPYQVRPRRGWKVRTPTHKQERWAKKKIYAIRHSCKIQIWRPFKQVSVEVGNPAWRCQQQTKLKFLSKIKLLCAMTIKWLSHPTTVSSTRWLSLRWLTNDNNKKNKFDLGFQSATFPVASVSKTDINLSCSNMIYVTSAF